MTALVGELANATPPDSPELTTRVFLSYSRIDADFVKRLASGLEARNARVSGDWLLDPGPDFRQQIRELILNSDTFVVVITPESAVSAEVANEVAIAQSLGKRIHPILHRDVTDSKVLPADVRRPQWAHIRVLPEDHAELDRFSAALRTDFSLLQMHTLILRRAEEWKASSRRTGALLRSDLLKRAEEWLPLAADPRKLPDPTGLQVEFISASRRYRTRLVQVVLGVFIVATAAALTVAAYAYRKQQIADSGRLAAQAEELRDRDHTAALNLALNAWRTAHTSDAHRAIADTFPAPPTVLQGHAAAIPTAAFSRDGRWIVTASRDDTARIWDPKTGETVATLQGHTNDVEAVAFSPDGQRIVTASSDKTARVWDAKSGNTLTTLQGHTEGVRSAQFSPSGKLIATTSNDKTARVWDAQTGRLLTLLQGHTAAVADAAFSADEGRIATAGLDGTARVWDARTGHTVATLEGHTEFVWHATFSPDGRRIATASSDGTVRVWDAQTEQTLVTLEGHDGGVGNAMFSADGQRS